MIACVFTKLTNFVFKMMVLRLTTNGLMQDGGRSEQDASAALQSLSVAVEDPSIDLPVRNWGVALLGKESNGGDSSETSLEGYFAQWPGATFVLPPAVTGEIVESALTDAGAMVELTAMISGGARFIA